MIVTIWLTFFVKKSSLLGKLPSTVRMSLGVVIHHNLFLELEKMIVLNVERY